MTQDSRCILIQPYIHLCSPQTSQKWQPASLRCCMAPVPLSSAAVCAAVAPNGLYAIGVRGVTVHLLYSCGFMSVSQRTGRMRGIRNSLPSGPCEYVSVTHIGSVRKGLLFYVSMECSDIKACAIIMLSGKKKFTSIRVKCAPL